MSFDFSPWSKSITFFTIATAPVLKAMTMTISRAGYEVVFSIPFSAARPARCPHLYRLRNKLDYRAFHASPSAHQKRKPRHKSLSKEELERLTAERTKQFRPYTDAERAALKHRYNPEQLAAIEAGEAAIDPRDLAEQAKFRRDYFVPQYLDDFSRIEPTIDKKIEKLRGDGSDYETAFEGTYHMPLEGDDFADASAIESGSASVGKWVIVQNEKGEPTGEQRFERTEGDIDNMAKEAFIKTPEYKALMDAELDKSDIIKNIKVPSSFYSKRVPIEEGDEAAEEVDEEDLANAFENIDIEALDRESESGVDAMKNHPKFIEIRNRFANAPIPSRYGFGTTEYDRRADDLFGGANNLPDVSPDIPKFDDPSVRWAPSSIIEEGSAEASGLEDEALASYQRVAKVMGQTVKQLRSYRVKVIVSHRVVNQTRLGKIDSIYHLCVAGNENGLVGIGEGKATEGDESMRMAKLNAIRNMVPILRYENRTIYGDVEAKVGATVVQMSARRPGFGVRTNQHIFEIARCAGLQDLAARTPRSRNPMNMAKAMWEALKKQRDPEDLARGRGKKLIDARKVYYSGLV